MRLNISSGCGFDRSTICVCGIWYAWARVDSTLSSGSGKWWFTNTQCTPFLVSSPVVYSIYGWCSHPAFMILPRLFSASYMSMLHTVSNGLVLQSLGLALPSWHFPKHSCTGPNNTIVDFVKSVTTIPESWSSIGSYPMGDFAFHIVFWNINILSSTFHFQTMDYCSVHDYLGSGEEHYTTPRRWIRFAQGALEENDINGTNLSSNFDLI